MSLKSKILLRISLALILSTVFIIAIVAIHIRISTLDSAKQKSTLVAEMTRDALTSHMVNGVMDKRDMFLSNITHLKGVEKLWIVRADTVNNQFGQTRQNEGPRDENDIEVLKTGKPIYLTSENILAASLRVTIPYIANSAIGQPNCMGCHQAKEGEVLGAISMEFNLGDIKAEGVETVGKIAFISIISLFTIILILNSFLNPYLELFGQLTDRIKSAHDGDYTQRVTSKLKDEAGQVAIWFNEFMQKLEEAFLDIEQNIGMFVAKDHTKKTHDPLEQTKSVVVELSNIYKFKRTIENDASKMDVYERIMVLLDHRFNIKNFTIYEVDTEKNSRKVLIVNGEKSCCSIASLSDSTLCRSNRIGKNVLSDDYVDVCAQFECKEKGYVCLPITIGGQVSMVINFIADTNEELDRIKQELPKIENYLEEATSVLESKKLMERLRESSLKDAMTGLYNRRFLEEYLTKSVPMTLRNKASMAILMIDMDHFKMVNDTFGHDVGDKVLKELSRVIADNIREGDLAVRYGGEEFIVILNNVITDEDAVQVAEKLRLKVKEMKVKAGNEVLRKTISIGVSVLPTDTDTVWKCIKFADVALYQAKETGRDKVIRFIPEMWIDDGTGY